MTPPYLIPNAGTLIATRGPVFLLDAGPNLSEKPQMVCPNAHVCNGVFQHRALLVSEYNLEMNVDVLIIGAGPTGLALACDLARRGVSFRIVDKAAQYFVGSRGKGLQPRSLEVLDDFGVVDEIMAHGRFHLPFRVYENGKVVGDRDPNQGRVPTPDTPYASSLIIPQWRVECILRAQLERLGHRVELATELTGLTQTTEEVAADLGAEHVTAKYLVGADGGHSFVRHALGIGFEGETWTTERMLIGDVEADGIDRDHWHTWLNRERGMVALCPLPSTNSFQFQGQIAPEDTSEPSLERFQQILDERSDGMQVQLRNATWLSLFRANIRMVDRYRVGRVFLAGDAAHVHSPAGGQGMNTGIQDAYNLGWKLGAVLKGAPAGLLDTYEEERLPVAAEMLGITSRLHRSLLNSGAKDVRRGPETLQLGINYRTSSLSQGEPLGALHPGDRAPDAPCRNSAGATVRLFDLFRGPHFTLLAFGSHEGLSNHAELRIFRIARPGETSDPAAIVDVHKHAANAYGIQYAYVLVRPDGYIGAITNNADLIGDYLNSAVAAH
jgi:2-polyprenyl-6-methoxyphenol hydroxylase-like FAD-dependent oxidoreductase